MAPDATRIPTVSVVLPTHNRPGYLKEAIESVLAQTYQDWELLVIDDGSTDETKETVQRYVQQDRRIRYIPQSQQGVSVARNTGIRSAAGRYLAFLDDDDLFLPKKLECQVAFLEAHPDTGMVYAYIDLVDAQLQFLDRQPYTPNWTFSGFISDCFILVHAVLVRTSCFEQLGGFRTDLRIIEDYEMWLRLSRSYQIAFLPECVGWYRKHGLNKTRDFVPAFVEQIRIHQGFLRRGCLTPQERQVLQESIGNLTHRLALSLYQRAAQAIEDGRYAAAARDCVSALRRDPLIGIRVPWGQGKSWLYRICRPYAGLAYCLWASVIARRDKIETAHVPH